MKPVAWALPVFGTRRREEKKPLQGIRQASPVLCRRAGLLEPDRVHERLGICVWRCGWETPPLQQLPDEADAPTSPHKTPHFLKQEGGVSWELGAA